jgi:hypothetical protein
LHFRAKYLRCGEAKVGKSITILLLYIAIALSGLIVHHRATRAQEHTILVAPDDKQTKWNVVKINVSIIGKLMMMKQINLQCTLKHKLVGCLSDLMHGMNRD